MKSKKVYLLETAQKRQKRREVEAMEYGYVRAQTGQNLKRQISEVAARVERENIVVDEDRTTQYQALKEKLRPGDLLVIKSLDRLGSSFEGILREWTLLTEGIRADILVLDMPLLDTRKEKGGCSVCGVVQEFLAFAAEKERQRTTLQAQGIRKAKERGVRFGRPRLKYTDEFIAAAKEYRSKKISLEQALQKTGVKKSSFYYHIKKLAELGYLPIQST